MLKAPADPAIPTEPESPETIEAKTSVRLAQAELQHQWHDDITLDFAALESSVTRIELLHESNKRERQRYAEEKVKILRTAESIKENTVELRNQLEEARNTFQSRQTFDKLAEKILNNKTLKSREDQEESQKKTNAEIADEQGKSEELEARWAKRQEQFSKVIDDLDVLQLIIRDEKEEAERAEGMEGVDEELAESGAPTSTAATPAADPGGVTPLPNHDVEALKPLPAGGSRAGSSAGSRIGSRAPSPLPLRTEDLEVNDVTMGDAGTPAGTHSSLEEGEENEEGEASETNTPMEQ